MKNIVKLIVAAVILAALAGSAYLGWSNYFGPGLDRRIETVNAAVKSAREAAVRIDAVSEKTKDFPGVWAVLTFDEESEVVKILEDANNNRGYKVDVLRDASASKVQKDIIEAEKELKAAIGDAKKSLKKLNGETGYLPAERRPTVKAAEDDARRALKKGAALAANLGELRYDIDIWGYISISLEINGLLIESFDAMSADLAAGNYPSVATAAQEQLVGVNESVTWLAHGRQELTNISVYSEDSDQILAFISEAKGVAEAFNNAASAGNRGDSALAAAEQERANRELAALKQRWQKQAVSTDFETWFSIRAAERL